MKSFKEHSRTSHGRTSLPLNYSMMSYTIPANDYPGIILYLSRDILSEYGWTPKTGRHKVKIGAMLSDDDQSIELRDPDTPGVDVYDLKIENNRKPFLNITVYCPVEGTKCTQKLCEVTRKGNREYDVRLIREIKIGVNRSNVISIG